MPRWYGNAVCASSEDTPAALPNRKEAKQGSHQRESKVPFETTEVEVIKEGDCLTLRPRGKDWSAYFNSETRGSLPARCQPPISELDG